MNEPKILFHSTLWITCDVSIIIDQICYQKEFKKCHLENPKKGEKYPKKGSSAAHWTSQTSQESLLVNAEGWAKDLNSVVKSYYNGGWPATSFLCFVNKSGVVYVCQTRGPAFEHSIMIVNMFEHFAQPFGSGCIGRVIERFVTHAGWISCQEGRLATNFLIKNL